MSNIMDILDEFVLGPLDLIDELLAPLLLRSTRMDKIRIPRADKSDSHSLNEVIDHLREHGVDCAPGNFSATEMTFYVRRSQRRWLNWLLRFDADGNTVLVRTKKRWKEMKPRRYRRGFVCTNVKKLVSKFAILGIDTVI